MSSMVTMAAMMTMRALKFQTLHQTHAMKTQTQVSIKLQLVLRSTMAGGQMALANNSGNEMTIT
eukprot:1503503-Pleurochrysis_carterae.AAC.1